MVRRLIADERDAGRAARKVMPRRTHGEISSYDRDPVALLDSQNAHRIADLVPVRWGRMLQSPFAFYRGSAALMAADLATGPSTGMQVVACGDAHLANFGLYASPERRIVFDLNDFDEASNAPWEWDVKRLAASVVVAGRDLGFDDATTTRAATGVAAEYRSRLAELFARSALERYYASIDTTWLDEHMADHGRGLLRKTLKKARRRTSEHVLHSLTTTDESGRTRIVDDPPLVRHPPVEAAALAEDVLAEYAKVLRSDIAMLVGQFALVDVAMRVVGVGSVGTQAYIALLEGPGGPPLFLQVKEASESVLASYGGIPAVPPAGTQLPADAGEGARVVGAQRILQAVSDPFLGWFAGPRRSFYVRQLRDMKGSIDLAALTASELVNYGRLCASQLARAHAQSPTAAFVAGYLGSSESFDEAIARWAVAYADQVERDHAALEAAADAGRIPVERGV
ncbi:MULTISPECIES: DUF2252 domain-containing protein [Mumia]|uniref:DUF2252 domain-containing protein n=1 Tax=Mumia TaxID=1546255 RepID=UPI00141DFEF8|nr:DUF2252 domain-containing protein [Mumia sp. ZJ1417]QMW65874.1 DUF2252 domain-containing protein [Mumia sp. ZJ1417]